MKLEEKQFIKELAQLLGKYEMLISFTCSEGSDTYGLSGDGICIDNKEGEQIYFTSSWCIEEVDLLEEVEDE